MNQWFQIIEEALQGKKYPIAQLISLFEDTRSRCAKTRKDVLAYLEKQTKKRATLIGITGTPGAGKSTLVGLCAQEIIERDEQMRVCVLAVDPTSIMSGGSILGDRTRVKFPVGENRLYFRSQASDRELGGIGRYTYQVTRLLVCLFDIVFIETIGIGQNEIEVRNVVDKTYLVLQPLGGDQIQFMKAGIMEVPDAFIINKSDAKKDALRSYHNLKSSINLFRPNTKEDIPIFLTSALAKTGIDELVSSFIDFSKLIILHKQEETRIQYFFTKWVIDEYGRSGERVLEVSKSEIFSVLSSSFEEAQIDFSSIYKKSINS